MTDQPKPERQDGDGLLHYPRRTVTGLLEIVDRQFDFVRAVLPYDYRFTCNAQQWVEAERICQALEGPMISHDAPADDVRGLLKRIRDFPHSEAPSEQSMSQLAGTALALLDAPKWKPKPAPEAMRSRVDAYRQRGGMLFSGFTVADDIEAALYKAVPAWPDHPGATMDAVAFVEGVKRYPNVDRDVPDLSHADNQAACQGAFINGFKRAMEMRTPPVRGDREAIAKVLWISRGGLARLWDEFKSIAVKPSTELTRETIRQCYADADAILSLHVQPYAKDA